MSPKFFDTQMSKIRAAFPNGFYDEVRIEMIWNHVQALDESEFAKIINHMIGSLRKPPVPIDFIEQAKSSRRYSSIREEKREWQNGKPPVPIMDLVRKAMLKKEET